MFLGKALSMKRVNLTFSNSNNHITNIDNILRNIEDKVNIFLSSLSNH